MDYMRIGEDAEVFEIRVEERAPVAGMTIAEAAEEGLLPGDMLVVAVERDGEGPPITPRGGTRIEAGDLVTDSTPRAAPPPT